MQRRILEVHAPQRIGADTPRLINASGWDSLRPKELNREFTRSKPKLAQAPLGTHWQKCSDQACALPLRTCRRSPQVRYWPPDGAPLPGPEREARVQAQHALLGVLARR